jgi:hypothetical protein
LTTYHLARQRRNEGLRERTAARHAEFRTYLNQIKAKPCEDCGKTFPPEQMHFHHRPGTEKKANVSDMDGAARATIDAETAKCDLLCASCHRERHGWKTQRAKVGV